MGRGWWVLLIVILIAGFVIGFVLHFEFGYLVKWHK